MLPNYLTINAQPESLPQQTVRGNGFRISVLTDRLFRVEISPTNSFCNHATQSVWYRRFENVHFSVNHKNTLLEIITDSVMLTFNQAKKECVSVTFADGKTVAVNNKGNLLGTTRTLDDTKGKVDLGYGVVSKSGVAVFSDDTYVLDDNGAVLVDEKRTGKDIYVFAHGKDYRGAVCDLYKICGSVPLLPRYALGNWWSRYHAYTQDEYCRLMENFEQKNIPLTVATVDMDWHWVDVNEKFDDKTPYGGKVDGSGWTGFSWNTELFPDWKGFISWLKKRNLAVTLNLHPAEGIRNFEDVYVDFCKRMSLSPNGKTIPFDFTDENFIRAYLELIMHPMENAGVDFWWIDWQQGKVGNFDPLWSLNHYHYLDSCKHGNKGLILSRYAGVGSHRYPLGFSGDTKCFWSTLRFQPYFTANASNIGFNWWSHDIGAHFGGYRDDELYLRWLQFGVFSPINRLHCSNNDLLNKEPWNYRKDVEIFASEFLRLRHRLIPYLYSANYRTHLFGQALCEPMYYAYPNSECAYNYPNQYLFGNSLLVCPIVSKTQKNNNLASVSVHIPQGRWTDVFNGNVYYGEKETTLFRELDTIPVLAKEGAIIPLSADSGNSCENPRSLEVWVFRGKGRFDMYEDRGERVAVTSFTVNEDGGIITLNISASGELGVIPQNRTFKVVFKDVTNGVIKGCCGKVFESIGNSIEFAMQETCASITVTNYKTAQNPDYVQVLTDKLTRLQTSNDTKNEIYASLYNAVNKQDFIEKLQKCNLAQNVKGSILELIT